jgi:hypothetical protein
MVPIAAPLAAPRTPVLIARHPGVTPQPPSNSKRLQISGKTKIAA